MDTAFEGMLADSGKHDIVSAVNAEASAEIGFGTWVKEGTSDGEALLPAAEGDDLLGIVVHTHAADTPADLGTLGIKPKGMLSVLRKGRIYVTVEEAVVPGNRVWVRAVAGGGEKLGATRVTDDSTDTIDATNVGRIMTTAGIGGLAVVEIDMTGKLAAA